MGTMAAAIAHEINQPLTAIVSYLEGSKRLLHRREGADAAAVLEALEASKQIALRIGEIIRRIRQLAAKGTAKIGPQDLEDLIRASSVLGLVDAAARGVRARLEVDPEARLVRADPVQIQQVLINLLRNSLEAMDKSERKELIVRTSNHSPDEVEVAVIDSGAGISASVREKLFTPFQSSKVEGMGLGLSISRAIIEAHGGRIWAEEAPGGGAAIKFTLQRERATEEPPAGA